MVGKQYGSVLIKKELRDGTEHAIGQEQYGFKEGRGCMDSVCCDSGV